MTAQRPHERLLEGSVGTVFGPFWGPLVLPKWYQDGLRWLQDGPKLRQDCPSWLQDGLKWRQDAPKKVPSWPKIASKRQHIIHVVLDVDCLLSLLSYGIPRNLGIVALAWATCTFRNFRFCFSKASFWLKKAPKIDSKIDTIPKNGVKKLIVCAKGRQHDDFFATTSSTLRFVAAKSST